MPSSDGGWLGVFLDEGDPNIQGARVTQVYPSGPAARAGIQLGDVITQINQQKVGGSADAVMLIREMQPQAHVELAVMRNKEELKIPVVLGSRQQSGYQSFYGGQGQFPPGQFAQGQFGQGQFPQGQGNGQQGYPGENQFQGVPPHAMQLESERRNFEQHERIEEEIRALRAEVQEIRKLLEKK
jgi:membrane-associated protease RseP (regulator of RpoE activity)